MKQEDINNKSQGLGERIVFETNINNQGKKPSKSFFEKLLDLFPFLIKKFPANFFFFIFLVAFDVGTYYIIIAVCGLVYSIGLESYENWAGLIVLLYLFHAFCIYVVSAIFLTWSILLINLSIKDVVKKETSITKRIFVFLSVCATIVILFKFISLCYEWIYP
jgi:hypothetical protein